jgi:hypothetical protein
VTKSRDDGSDDQNHVDDNEDRDLLLRHRSLTKLGRTDSTDDAYGVGSRS